MMEHLIEAITLNKNEISLRAIVLAANSNVFSAGHNLKELVSAYILTIEYNRYNRSIVLQYN